MVFQTFILFQIKDPESGEILLPPPNLHAKIFAVKRDVISGNEGGTLLFQQLHGIDNISTLFDVGLKGNEEKVLINSYAIFSGLKFKTTSYNHEGSPFYLVISIYQGSINEAQNSKLFTMAEVLNQVAGDRQEGGSGSEDEEGTGCCSETKKEKGPEPPKVLISKISPALFINSRKLAKETSTKKYHTVIEAFDLQAVEQDLFIRSNKIYPRAPVTTASLPNGVP